VTGTGPRGRVTRLRRGVRRALLRRRRLLAALLVGVAVVAGLHALREPPPDTRTVAVPGRDLSAGHVLTADDLEDRAVPVGLLPSGVVESPEGRRLATPVRAGEPVTDVRLSGNALLASYPGLAAVPLRIPDPGAVGLLAPGDLVDVLATDPRGGTSRLLLVAAPVLGLPPADDQPTAAGTVGGRLVVLGVPPQDREEVASAMVGEYLSLSLRD
jgi:Flp pilus assembly protein CpaB